MSTIIYLLWSSQRWISFDDINDTCQGVDNFTSPKGEGTLHKIPYYTLVHHLLFFFLKKFNVPFTQLHVFPDRHFWYLCGFSGELFWLNPHSLWLCLPLVLSQLSFRVFGFCVSQVFHFIFQVFHYVALQQVIFCKKLRALVRMLKIILTKYTELFFNQFQATIQLAEPRWDTTFQTWQNVQPYRKSNESISKTAGCWQPQNTLSPSYTVCSSWLLMILCCLKL